MNKAPKNGYILGSLLFITGIILWIALWQIGTTVLLVSIFMVLCGILSVFIQWNLNKITELRIKAEQHNPKRQIVITINDDGNVVLVAEGMHFNELITMLEVSKYQMISQHTQGGSNPMQIIKRP